MKKLSILVAGICFLWSVLFLSSCKKDTPLAGTTWSITYNWNSGSKGTTLKTFNADHTILSNGISVPGSWTQSGANFSITFSGVSTGGLPITATYKGTVNGKKMSGITSNDYSDSGTFSGTEN